MRLLAAPLYLLAAVARFVVAALLGLIEPILGLILGSLALLALLLAGFYAFAGPYRAFPVFGLLAMALTLCVLIALMRLARRALSSWR